MELAALSWFGYGGAFLEVGLKSEIAICDDGRRTVALDLLHLDGVQLHLQVHQLLLVLSVV